MDVFEVLLPFTRNKFVYIYHGDRRENRMYIPIDELVT